MWNQDLKAFKGFKAFKSSEASKDPADVSAQDARVDDGDENPERGNWTNKTEHMLSMFGYAIGLGNIWRFPYVAYKNGGGAFLIPYFLTLVLCGTPLFFMESAIGQFCSQGAINMWRAVPLLQGVGITFLALNSLVSIYYNVIISYGLFYMFASFQSPLPWTGCFSWADSSCSEVPLVYCNVSGVLMANWTHENGTSCSPSDLVTVPVQSPSEQYWDRVALLRSSGPDETGPVVWHLALCLLLGSMIVAAALTKGIKSSGKVVYFTAPLPYVVILVLVIRGVTLEGAADGIEFYIGSKSNFSKLVEAEVWKDAATQTFYSLSVAWGGIVTLSSYSKFHNNMLLDSLLISMANHVTSVFAGFAIFSILGHMAFIYRKPVSEVVKEGFGLAFIAYPEALGKLPLSPLWSILFFFMLFIVGLDTQFTIIEAITTCLVDAFPEKLKPRRALLSLGVCAIIFLLGLPCVTGAGIYWVTLLDHSTAGWILLLLALLEIIAFSYIYGANRLVKDIEMMIGEKSALFWLWWRTCWFGLTPCIIVVILVWSLMSFMPPSYGTLPFPNWMRSLGICMKAFMLLWIPVVALYKITGAQGTLLERLKTLCTPAEEWRPFLEIHRGERYSQGHCAQKEAFPK